jgi:hypothetical protein
MAGLGIPCRDGCWCPERGLDEFLTPPPSQPPGQLCGLARQAAVMGFFWVPARSCRTSVFAGRGKMPKPGRESEQIGVFDADRHAVAGAVIGQPCGPGARMACLGLPTARSHQAVGRGPLIRLPDSVIGVRRLRAAAQAGHGALHGQCCSRFLRAPFPGRRPGCSRDSGCAGS